MTPTAFAQLNPSTQAATINMLTMWAHDIITLYIAKGPNWRYWSEHLERFRNRIGTDAPYGLPFPGSSPTPKAFCTSLQEAEWVAGDVNISPVSEEPFDICQQVYVVAYDLAYPEA